MLNHMVLIEVLAVFNYIEYYGHICQSNAVSL